MRGHHPLRLPRRIIRAAVMWDNGAFVPSETGDPDAGVKSGVRRISTSYILAGSIAGLILAAGALLATLKLYLAVRGIAGSGESPQLYLTTGIVALAVASALLATAGFMLWALVSPGRAARCET
jgi:hypothetical protein